MKTDPIQEPYKNRILAALPASEINLLAPHLTPAIFRLSQTLHSPGQTIETVYFLEDGICSIVVAMENGTTIEVGIIGPDGFVGAPAVLGTGYSPHRSFMQIPGSGFSIKAKVLRERADASAPLRLCLQKSVEGLLAQTAQTAACNRVHELEERLARWLMMCHDRVLDDHLPITQEFLAMMLGTRRTSVTVAAGMLHKSGLISYSRGHVTIQDRDGLINAACECYQIVRDEYVRLGLL
jgi:CRP-like cAMP-binding protein